MAKYQLQMHQVLDDGTDVFLYPINTALDVQVGKLSTGSLTLPGSASDEILAETLANIKKYLTNLGTVAEQKRGVSNSTTSTSEIDLATSKAVNDLKVRIDGNDETLSTHTTEISGKAPINHAVNALTYGGATGTLYGHVMLSDTYSTAVANGAAANSIGASQNALFNAYNALNTSKAPNNHAVNNSTYGLGTASLYGHVKLSDTYATKVTDGAAENALGASQNALYNAYNALKTVNDDQTTAINGKAPTQHASTAAATYGAGTGSAFGHVMLSDAFDSDNSGTGASANSVGASSWAVYRAYSNLATAVSTKLAATHANEKATASKFSHVKLSDNYTSSAGAASAGIGASSLAVYNTYAAFSSFKTSAENSISSLNSRTVCFNNSGQLSNNLGTTGGATFATDGNVFLNSNGYCDWLTNILSARIPTSASCNKNWNWSGQGGQPKWVWGGNEDATNMFVYDPSNFQVARCTDGIISPPAGVVVDLSADGGEFRSYNSSYNIIDDIVKLGSPNARWKQLYAATTTISTSDRNLKNNIKPLSDKYMEFFKLLQPVSFTFKDSDSGRTHVGFISQDVEDALEKVGFSALDFSGFCKDVKTTCQRDKNKNEKEIPVLDKDGNPEYIYSLRYEEFIALNTRMIQELSKEIQELFEEVKKLKGCK